VDDTDWVGHVCTAPRLNGSCLKLKHIAVERDDAAEEAVARRRLGQLPQAQWSARVAERMAFMVPFEYVRTANHLYNRVLRRATAISRMPYGIRRCRRQQWHSRGSGPAHGLI
jgi:hypothetical protein